MNKVFQIQRFVSAFTYRRLSFLAICLFLFVACSPETAQPVTSTPEQIERGAQLYNANCASCHGGATGGSMMDVPPPHNANGHTWHHPDCQLIDTILDGSGEMSEMMRQMMGVPEDKPRMPAFKDTLDEEEVRAILAHIRTWWTDEQRQHQERITRQTC